MSLVRLFNSILFIYNTLKAKKNSNKSIVITKLIAYLFLSFMTAFDKIVDWQHRSTKGRLDIPLFYLAGVTSLRI